MTDTDWKPGDAAVVESMGEVHLCRVFEVQILARVKWASGKAPMKVDAKMMRIPTPSELAEIDRLLPVKEQA